MTSNKTTTTKRRAAAQSVVISAETALNSAMSMFRSEFDKVKTREPSWRDLYAAAYDRAFELHFEHNGKRPQLLGLCGVTAVLLSMDPNREQQDIRDNLAAVMTEIDRDDLERIRKSTAADHALAERFVRDHWLTINAAAAMNTLVTA